ncbi:MAG: hypothetical protein NVSMB9_10760 [Isosphaeraceae bacterium]
MTKALAPGLSRDSSRVWLPLLISAGFLVGAHAQDQEKGKAETKKSGQATSKTNLSSKKADSKPDANKKSGTVAGPAAKTEPLEIFTDPRAEQALGKQKSIPGLRDTNPANVSAVKAMAAEGAVDTEAIQRFVQGMAFQLTDKRNINALVSPSPDIKPNSAAARAIQNATDNLLDALNTAKLAKNTRFLSAYNKELVATLPKLLDNHLVSRIQAMIVLGQTGSPSAVPIFLAQLKDPNQTIWVKLWAAKGLSLVVNGGTQVDAAISAEDAITAGKVLADFLGSEKDIPWPATVRAIEALGAMRQAAVPTNMQKSEMAVAAMRYLADTRSRPEVRAEAARALGMMRVNAAIGKFNFPLIAYHIGQLAAQIGEQSQAAFPRNPGKSQYLTGLLLSEIHQAFHGVEGARESGLLKIPFASSDQTYLSAVADLTDAVARSSVELIRSGGKVEARQKALGERVAALKSYLDKNPPKDFHLVPGDMEFRGENATVVEAPPKKTKVARAPGGE